MKFKNCHGLSGTFTFDNKKYSFLNGVFEVHRTKKLNKEATKEDIILNKAKIDAEESLIKFLTASTAWTDYQPTSEDKVKESKEIIEGLKKEILDLKNGDNSIEIGLREENKELKELLTGASKEIEELKKKIK